VVTDTAGIRRKASIALKVEAFSVVRAMKAIDQAEVVACLLDAAEAGVEQDARLLGLVAEKAKALVVVVNKWDLAEREGATQDWYEKELNKRLPFVAWAPMVFVSAKERRGVTKVLDRAAKLVEQYRARFPTPELNELLANPGIIRNRLKIRSAIQNARAFLAVQQEFGSFDAYLWSFVDGQPVHNTWEKLSDIPARTPLSDRLSKDLVKRGFNFVGSTICYALMQAIGMVNDHQVDCFRYAELKENGTPV